MQMKLLHWLTWLLNCGLAPAPAAGHPPPAAAAGPAWIGVPVLEGVTECVTPFWRDIWASICPAEGPGCAICGVICELILTCLLRSERSERGLLLVIYWEKKRLMLIDPISKHGLLGQNRNICILKCNSKHTVTTIRNHLWQAASAHT